MDLDLFLLGFGGLSTSKVLGLKELLLLVFDYIGPFAIFLGEFIFSNLFGELISLENNISCGILNKIIKFVEMYVLN